MPGSAFVEPSLSAEQMVNETTKGLKDFELEAKAKTIRSMKAKRRKYVLNSLREGHYITKHVPIESGDQR